MTDGKYTIELTLSGGTGKAHIESPASLEIKDGVMTAELVWSSSNFDYMKIGDAEYYPVSGEKNSTFLVEVPVLDDEIPVLAETVAMSKPHLIEYTLYFDSATIKESNTFPLWAVFVVAALALGTLAAVILIRRCRKNEIV